MLYCDQCGTPNTDNAKYCNECGAFLGENHHIGQNLSEQHNNTPENGLIKESEVLNGQRAKQKRLSRIKKPLLAVIPITIIIVAVSVLGIIKLVQNYQKQHAIEITECIMPDDYIDNGINFTMSKTKAEIYFRSHKTIKYITFEVSVMNKVDDVIDTCTEKFTGPYSSDDDHYAKFSVSFLNLITSKIKSTKLTAIEIIYMDGSKTFLKEKDIDELLN